ncbi:hypothetical protein BX070DRAFT_93046 [Coemansia spiralis]|nr:hypothetical protein BX070DRAFT_93046 [Coemansia spiralis]
MGDGREKNAALLVSGGCLLLSISGACNWAESQQQRHRLVVVMLFLRGSQHCWTGMKKGGPRFPREINDRYSNKISPPHPQPTATATATTAQHRQHLAKHAHPAWCRRLLCFQRLSLFSSRQLHAHFIFVFSSSLPPSSFCCQKERPPPLLLTIPTALSPSPPFCCLLLVLFCLVCSLRAPACSCFIYPCLSQLVALAAPLASFCCL